MFRYFSKICREYSKFHQYLARITGIVHEDLLEFMVISRWILRKMRIVPHIIFRENQNKYFTFNTFYSESCDLFLVGGGNMKNMVQPDGARMKNMAHALCVLDY